GFLVPAKRYWLLIDLNILAVISLNFFKIYHIGFVYAQELLRWQLIFKGFHSSQDHERIFLCYKFHVISKSFNVLKLIEENFSVFQVTLYKNEILIFDRSSIMFKIIKIDGFCNGVIKALSVYRLMNIIHGIIVKRLKSIFCLSGNKNDLWFIGQIIKKFKSCQDGHFNVKEDKVNFCIQKTVLSFNSIVVFGYQF